MKKCVFCGEEVDDKHGVGRRDECLNCGNDLHCCLQCIFYDTSYSNDCRENQAELISIKDKSNFCSYFEFGRDEQEKMATKYNVKSELEKLFKK